MQRDLFWTKNCDVLSYNSLYRVHLEAVVDKSGFVRPETLTRNSCTTWNSARKALKSSSKDLLTEKNLAGRPKTTCLSENLNGKLGEVELAAAISSGNSPEKTKYGQSWKTSF